MTMMVRFGLIPFGLVVSAFSMMTHAESQGQGEPTLTDEEVRLATFDT